MLEGHDKLADLSSLFLNHPGLEREGRRQAHFGGGSAHVDWKPRHRQVVILSLSSSSSASINNWRATENRARNKKKKEQSKTIQHIPTKNSNAAVATNIIVPVDVCLGQTTRRNALRSRSASTKTVNCVLRGTKQLHRSLSRRSERDRE